MSFHAKFVVRLASWVSVALLALAGCGGPEFEEELPEETGEAQEAVTMTLPAFLPVADAVVKEDFPTQNFGADPGLGTDTVPRIRTYLRFTVSGIPSNFKVQSATVKVYATSGTDNGPGIQDCSNTWDENTITWSNMPADHSGYLTDLSTVGANVWVSLPVTAAVTGNGTFSFMMEQLISSDGMYFPSSEYTTDTSKRPQLVVTVIPKVGATGGTVDLMKFLLTGDTRPASNVSTSDTSTYPKSVINAIADQAQARLADFAIDAGDHMAATSSTAADAQMDAYEAAMNRYKGTWFPTFGNHECSVTNCKSDSTETDYRFRRYMQTISARLGKSRPYYTFDVNTRFGVARFVVIADNANALGEQDNWLESVLTTADTAVKYTIVTRHHPSDDTTNVAWAMPIIARHKVDLLLTGHVHKYSHLTAREAMVGTGGGPLSAGGYYGFAMVTQLADARLQVQMYDLSNPPVLHDTWSVAPLR